jgi:archaellum component FlaF (FlaF/FlaG flagellin family)
MQKSVKTFYQSWYITNDSKDFIMSLLQRIAPVVVCLLLFVGFTVDNGQSLRPEKGLYDFEIAWTINASLNLNSENPMGLVMINVTITNTGLMPDDYTINESCSAGWPTVISPQSLPLVVPPGGSFNIFFTMVLPQAIPPGTVCNFNVIVQSTYSPQKITKEKDTRLVLHCPFISVRHISTSPTRPMAGQEATIIATLMNGGDFYEPMAKVSFFIDGKPFALNVSAGWINPGESKNVTVNWTAVEGSHTIEARTERWFSDDENNSQTVKIEVRAGLAMTKNEIEIGVFSSVGIILIVALIIYHKKKKFKRERAPIA